MGINSYVRDPKTKKGLNVNKDGAIVVSVIEQSGAEVDPAVLTRNKIWRQWFTNPLAANTIEMDVDGSITSVEYKVGSELGRIKYIQALRLILNDSNMEMNTNDFRRFGNAATTPGLSNGLELYLVQDGAQVDIFTSPVKTIGDFLNYSDAWENIVNAVDVQTDFLSFDFILPKPVALIEGTNDYISVKINDDLTAIDLFRTLTWGYYELVSQ